MNHYDTDPAAEIKRLKAIEKAKLNPTAWPAPDKAKKWPTAPDLSKLTRPQAWRPLVDNAESAPWQPGGVSLSDAIRAILALAVLIGLALGVD